MAPGRWGQASLDACSMLMDAIQSAASSDRRQFEVKFRKGRKEVEEGITLILLLIRIFQTPEASLATLSGAAEWLLTFVSNSTPVEASDVLTILVRATTILAEDGTHQPLRCLLAAMNPRALFGHALWYLFALKCPRQLCRVLSAFLGPATNQKALSQVLLALADHTASSQLRKLRQQEGDGLPQDDLDCTAKLLFTHDPHFAESCRQHPVLSLFGFARCKLSKKGACERVTHQCMYDYGRDLGPSQVWESAARCNPLCQANGATESRGVALAVKSYQEGLVHENWQKNRHDWMEICDAATSGDPTTLIPLVFTIQEDMKTQGAIPVKTPLGPVPVPPIAKVTFAPSCIPAYCIAPDSTTLPLALHTPHANAVQVSSLNEGQDVLPGKRETRTKSESGECAQLKKTLSALQVQIDATNATVAVLEKKMKDAHEQQVHTETSLTRLQKTNRGLAATNKKSRQTIDELEERANATHHANLALQADKEFLLRTISAQEQLISSSQTETKTSRDRASELALAVDGLEHALKMAQTEKAANALATARLVRDLEQKLSRAPHGLDRLRPADEDGKDELLDKRFRLERMLAEVATAQDIVEARGPECPMCFHYNGPMQPCTRERCQSTKLFVCESCALLAPRCPGCV